MKPKSKKKRVSPGQIYGRLTVIGHDYRKADKTFWICRCQCGRMTIVENYSLLGSKTKSCGCLQIQFAQSIITRTQDRQEINDVKARRILTS